MDQPVEHTGRYSVAAQSQQFGPPSAPLMAPRNFRGWYRWKRSRPRHQGVGDGADSLESFRGNAPKWNVGEFPVVTLSSRCQSLQCPDGCNRPATWMAVTSGSLDALQQVRSRAYPADRKPFPVPGRLWLLGYYSKQR
jgi:hypothetical protein